MLMGSNKDIAHIIFKKSVIEDMDEYKNYSSSLRAITKFNLIQETKNAIVELDSLDQLESALLSVKQQGFKIANSWFEGKYGQSILRSPAGPGETESGKVSGESASSTGG